MADNDEWTNLLRDHPIFSLPKSLHGPLEVSNNALELSTNTLPNFTKVDSAPNLTPSGRRQVMILKDADVIVAAGKEIRMSSFGDLKLSRSMRKTYKTLHTPTIEFETRQIALNPSGKLLAVAGAYQVAVIVLPRSGYNRLVPESIDCKSVQVGQFYHAADNAAPIAKIDWHPWGEAGSTLLVMTVDGKFREYDISVDTEEPQQVLSFVPNKKPNSYMAEDDSEREVTSFTLGKGQADWGPLTVYALMKSGDIYAMCPYMPRNASIPSSYIHSLDCFISAKQEYLQETAVTAKSLSPIYDYQRKYVTSLVKQLPPGTAFPATSKKVSMHPPTTINAAPLRQGPFLLQPSPLTIEGGEGGDATDIVYLAFGMDDVGPDDDRRDTQHLGALLVSYQDGKVDFFLDVEKVEARWESKQVSNRDLPMLAVYETIDLGLVEMLNQVTPESDGVPLLDLLNGNHPVFLLDPLHDDMLYLYHAFGVHALDISPVLQNLAASLREDGEDDAMLTKGLEKAPTTNVQPILNTFSVERKCSNPITAVVIPNDVYLTYSIFILTSMMRITSFPLTVTPEPLPIKPAKVEEKAPAPVERSKWLTPAEGPPGHVSALGTEPYKPPAIASSVSGLPSIPKLSLPGPPSGSKELVLTPDTFRFIAKTVAQITSQLRDIHLAYRAAMTRTALQGNELVAQVDKCATMEKLLEDLKGARRQRTQERFEKVQAEQKALLARMDRVLQAMMKQASPELSEHETKWFEELKRMKQEILGAGRYDEDSLLARTRLLEKEYARILPSLKNLVEKQNQRGKQRAENAQQLGFSQAFEYGERSNFDRTRINQVEKEVEKLALQLDLTLGRPPSAQ
ncbi:hypothetical protein D9613_005509 [Agrocybe pediades]|uniref:Nucleoporin nup82 n=1 Tax=Agrocybe pediades TaxID=84607 RepID=A0A8H4QYB8_9AGAR|nr:hypothetical protein D9613_005509 [Agrocybe pediades]